VGHGVVSHSPWGEGPGGYGAVFTWGEGGALRWDIVVVFTPWGEGP
jgi:hypothetical protein